MTKVLIVDDHETLRDSFTRLFAQHADEFTVIGELPSASYAEVFCARKAPDLVLMDVCTEGGASGLEATAKLRTTFPCIKIVVMSGFDEISYAPRARDAGADAFVYKTKSLDFFLQVIRDVMNGQRYFPEPKTIPMPEGEAPFTSREMEILRLLCKHRSRREIAQELFISESTVKRHVEHMLAKSGFADTVELAFYMISNGWINPLY